VVNYKLDFSDEGKISFSSFDKAVAQRILNKLKWFTQHIEDVSPLPLKWKYEGLFKLRIGDWRVIYDINHDQKVITVHKVGHRREIYKQ
jgi:mRNA interferase RelE/StbE